VGNSSISSELSRLYDNRKLFDSPGQNPNCSARVSPLSSPELENPEKLDALDLVDTIGSRETVEKDIIRRGLAFGIP
jgi:hypothetical protein